MIGKRSVLLTGALAVILLVAANTRTWVNGSVTDAVLQGAHTAASGSKASPALLAAALVGAAAVLAFAVLFRLEGPRTRAERLQREAEVQRCHEVYLQAEAHLKAVLNEGFNERMEEFTTVRAAYDEACRVLRTVSPLRAEITGV